MLMHDKIELKMLCLSFPPLPILCIVLRFDDFFLQGKAVP
jgi:hypothetical protein